MRRLAFLVYKVFIMGPYVDSMFYGQPIGMGETTIVADATGVNATSAGIEIRIPWDKVQDVIVTNEHLFLMFARLVGVIVPRRAFADDGEAQRFAEFVRSKTPEDRPRERNSWRAEPAARARPVHRNACCASAN